MGDYSVPEHIRAMEPKGTMVKAISGNYYVYEHRSATKDGKRRTEMGRCIGSVKEGVGFVANGNRAADSEVTSLEYGQYALILSASRGVHGMLARHFNAQDAAAVYAMAVVNCANGAVPMKSCGRHLSMSALSVRFPSLRLGPDAVSTLVDALGRRQTGVLSFEEELCASCGREVAVGGHAIPSHSDLNDLCEAGYRRARLGSEQVNLLVAFDVASGRPVMTRVYEGAALDKCTVGDLLGRHDLRDKTFIVDSGFYSAANLETLSSNGCSYVMPLHKGLRGCKEAVADARADGRFVYRRSEKAPAIEYRERRGPKGARIILYRDPNKAALEQSGYLAKIEQGARGYTQEGYERARDVMGAIVLQTSDTATNPQEVYETYKGRRSVEAYYDYLKSNAGFTSLGVSDYCKAQGLAFMMLVTSLVHDQTRKACEGVKGKSVDDCLLEARMVKANKVRGRWVRCNMLERQRKLFEAVGAPLAMEDLLKHT